MQKSTAQGQSLLARTHQKFNWSLLSMAVPGMLFLVAFNYLPLILGWFMPFKKISYSKGIFDSPWCGFENFKFYFTSQDAFRTTRNTVLLNLLFIAVTITLSVLLALLMFQLTKTSIKLYQTAIFIPYFVSWVVASYILYAFISPDQGVISNLLEMFGKEQVNFYTKANAWPLILLLCYIWKNIGYNTLLFYASLISIDSTLLEAAAIDGASRWQRMIHVAIPHIMPIVIMMTLLSIGKIFYSDFGMFYFLTKDTGALYATTDVIDTYIYRALRVTGDLGLSAAVCLYQSIVGFILVLISNLIVRKTNPDYAIF